MCVRERMRERKDKKDGHREKGVERKRDGQTEKESESTRKEAKYIKRVKEKMIPMDSQSIKLNKD